MRSFRSSLLLTLLLMVCGNLFTVAVQAQSSAPRIFYSDLQSGPSTGGQNNQGAFVTIFGKGFGATRGASTITAGGAAAYSYPVWTDTQVTFQLSSAAVAGNTTISMKVGGTASNSVPFVIRSGKIYFVSTSGSDKQQGTYSSPWRTLAKAVTSMAPGDITYAMNNVAETSSKTGTAALTINRAGTSGKPMAIVKYPGASVTVGSTAANIGVQVPTGGNKFWVLSGLKLRGTLTALNVAGATDWRVVGNDISCPNGSGTGACINATSSSRMTLLGNNVHDNGSTSSKDVKGYESVNISASFNVEFGWNRITNTRSCQALRFSTSGPSLYGLVVHDNYISDAVCEGIVFSSVDPSQGAVRAYNNVLQHVGTGPAPGGVEANYACISAAGSGSGAVEILHNTMVDCGARANSNSGAIAASTNVVASNNIVSLSASESYVTPNTSSAWLSGSNNIFYGAGAAPAPFQNSINSDPLFVDPANANYSVQSGSSAIDAGMNSGITTDFEGAARPQGKAHDIGAYEFSGTASTSVQLAFNPTALDFGTVATGASSTQTVSLSNTGTASATVTGMPVTGAGFSATGITLPLTLSAGQSTSFAVTFAPQSAGNVSGSIAPVTSTGTTVGALQLSGTTGSSAGQLVATPTTLSFGSVTTGATQSQAVTVTASTASVTISQANVAGAGFTLSGLTLPATIAAGKSATFQVNFAPTVAGSVTGSVSLVSNASNATSTIALSGTGADSTSTSPSQYSIWPTTAKPALIDAGDAAAVELGVQFKADVSGSITGIRYYKSSTNTGTHIGNLWSSTGTRLATATFTGETASGWQQVNFAKPVAVTAGTVYVASYFTPTGHYSHTQNQFTTAGFDAPPLHALQNGGVFAYGSSSTFPAQTWNGSNYWVDVVFSSGGGAPSTGGTLSVNPTALNFSNVAVGSSSTQNVTLTASNGSVTISQASATGAGFSISGLTLPATIAAGQSATLQVKFAPTTTGAVSGSISLASDATNPTTSITLSGTGSTATGTLAVSPTSLSFGNVTTGTTKSQAVTVTASTASVTISQANVTGAGFAVTGLTLPTTIAAGQSATFNVTFTPTTAGSAAGSLSLVSNASNSPNVSLSGSGVNPVGALSISPASLSFGSVTTGATQSQAVTVTASTASVTISQANVAGAGFTLSGLTLPATIAAGKSATFQVNFAPTVAGSVTGSVSLVSNASNATSTIALSGTGADSTSTSPSQYSIWPTTAKPALIDSGDAAAVELGVQFKADVSGSITGIRYYKSSTNTGTHIGNLWSSTGTRLATATFTGETASGWQQVNFANPVAVTAGTVYVASYFTPTGHYSDTQNQFTTAGVDAPPLHTLQNGGVFAYGSSSTFPAQTWSGSNYWVDVVFSSGGGAPSTGGTLSVNPGALNFSNVAVGSSSTQNVTLTASNGSVTISQASATGAGFSISGLTLPATIAAGQSATLQVKFAPSTAGSASGTLSLSTNAANSPSVTLSGSGTSGTSTSHSATLTWNASTSSNVAGYFVYRGTQASGPYTKVNPTSVSALTYNDSTVLGGTTYYYVVTAVDNTGSESAYSTQVTAAVPAP